MTIRAKLAVAFSVVVVGASARAAAAEDEEPMRPPLPESLLTESATDVDATERGEVEIEANLATLGARRGGARATLASLELEWRVLLPVGLRVEPSYAHVVDAGGVSSRDVFGASGALAFALFHDFEHDAHLQGELLGRFPRDEDRGAGFQAGDTELPYAADLVGAVRRDRLTLRATVGAEAGRAPAHAPLHTDVALLTGFVREERFGFFALEARVDWARQTPFVLAPEIVADATPLAVPLRLGVALPWNVGASGTTPSYGLFVRLMLLTSREAEYGRTGGK
jgi:hypothetical protein